MTQGILCLGNFVITHENHYWSFTLIPVLAFHIKPLSVLGPPSSTLCSQKCCSGASLVAVRSISKVKKGTQRPYNLSPVKLNCLILRRELCQGSHPHQQEKPNRFGKKLHCTPYIYKGVHFNLQSKTDLCHNQSLIGSLFRTFNTGSTNNRIFQCCFHPRLMSSYTWWWLLGDVVVNRSAYAHQGVYCQGQKADDYTGNSKISKETEGSGT